MKLQSKSQHRWDSAASSVRFVRLNTLRPDYDHSANFGQYKTYSWEKVKTKDQLVVDRIKSAGEQALWRQRVGRKFLGR